MLADNCGDIKKSPLKKKKPVYVIFVPTASVNQEFCCAFKKKKKQNVHDS